MRLAFNDFEKALDSMCPRDIIEALTYKEIEKPYQETLNKLYKVAITRIIISDDTPEFPITKSLPIDG